jgi:RimJ/RimL family protein N-acetyltransferase
VPWLPDGFVHPAGLALATGHHLRPIRESDADLDYPAVMGSRDRLWAQYGDAWGWPPETMTFEHDRADLARHADEMVKGLSFNYAIFDAGERELLGCVYIDPPEPPETADAVVSWWIVDAGLGTPLDRALDEAVPRWLTEEWPFATVRYGV